MEIGSTKKCPANALSNLCPHEFTIDGITCASMEGFLQSLKFKSLKIQQELCALSGIKAQRRGRSDNGHWQRHFVLWWKGVPYGRFGQEYQELLDRAFGALSRNADFQKALLATGDEVLTHSIGRFAGSETVLTKAEFCDRLMEIRERLQQQGP